MKTTFVTLFISLTCLAYSQHPNITLGTKNDPCEPSIAVNPNNTNQLMAGSVLANCYTSIDAGLTWDETILKSEFGVYGDPAIIADYNNAFYFFHLSNPLFGKGSWVDRTVCQKTLDMGKTWILDSYSGLNNTKVQDKHWIAVNPKTNALYTTWTEFDAYESKLPNDSSRILFTKSMDGGSIWSKPIKINKISGDCLDGDNTVEGAVPCVGPNGEIYVSWAGPVGLRFDKSTDEGETWNKEDILINEMPGSWTFDIPGISRANGLPITACDISGGKNNGTIYVNWCDQRNGVTDTDVWLSKSIDGGSTWSQPIKVNDDPPGKQQFFTWMSIDQSNGNLWFVFYDRRNYTDNQTDVYMAMSDDGGNSFVNFKVSDSPFVPNTDMFFGDYNNLTAHKNVIRPIWTRLENKNLSVHTAIIDADYVNELKNKLSLPITNINILENKKVQISFEVNTSGYYSIKVLDLKENAIAEITKSKFFKTGKKKLKFNKSESIATKGIYKVAFFNQEQEKVNGKQLVIFN